MKHFFYQKWYSKDLFVVECIFYTHSISKFIFLNPTNSILYIKKKTCKKMNFFKNDLKALDAERYT